MVMATTRSSARLARERLLDSGVDMLTRQGFHGTGLKELLEQEKIPKGSFYNYFESKDAFGAAAIAHYAAGLGAALEQSLTGSATPLDGLRLFFQRRMAHFEAEQFLTGCLVANLGAELDDNAVCGAALQSASRGWRSGLANALADAQRAGTIRHDLPASELADLLSDAWEGALIRMKIERTLRPLQQVIARLLDDYFLP
jgi:TetR/AcrR family transcriptional regulator, transcriptional repressor for nem operon